MTVNISQLTDEELIRHVENEHDPLTSTNSETELFRRFVRLFYDHESNKKRMMIFDKFSITDAELDKRLEIIDDFDALDIRSLLEVITAAGFDTASALKAKLELADKFVEFANDAGDTFARLQNLISTTQE